MEVDEDLGRCSGGLRLTLTVYFDCLLTSRGRLGFEHERGRRAHDFSVMWGKRLSRAYEAAAAGSLN